MYVYMTNVKGEDWKTNINNGMHYLLHNTLSEAFSQHVSLGEEEALATPSMGGDP